MKLMIASRHTVMNDFIYKLFDKILYSYYFDLRAFRFDFTTGK